MLLGEPGAGKSTVFKEEAEAIGGCHLRIAKFIHLDDVSPLTGKDLFLDGLDEVRAGQGDTSVLIEACERLKRLGNPRFRIACRAADWHGSSDRAEITSASPDRTLAVLRLEPLTHDQIGEILRENHEISDPATFIDRARDNGVAELLENPQTLELLAKAIHNKHWPSSRDETFDLATRKLAEEANKTHRDRQRTNRIPIEHLLNAAGHLCAAMLLSDKDGVALDPARATHRYPWIEDYGADDTAAATAAVGSRLFHPEHEERLEPAHRSVAEYLAGRWLAERINHQGLPVGRVLNLLLGVDGRTVAGLRGLYAWLAVHCEKARRRMIDADPMTVVLYGDAKPLPAKDKRRILTGLRREAESHTAFRRDASRDKPLGALADSALTDNFASALETPDRGDAAQAFAGCVLDILAKGEPLPVLSDVVKRVIADPTWWGGVRKYAMRAWLALPPPADEAVALLDDIRDDRISDSDDELAGLLLQHLYPDHIAPERLLRYLHVVKDPHLLGHYAWFWTKDVPERAPDEHLPTILDQLAPRTDLPFFDPYELRLDRVACHLLARGIEAHGETVAVERLWSWFGMGFTEYHQPRWDDAARQRVAAWLRAHPDVHKHMLALCFQRCADHENPDGCLYRNLRRIEDFAPPDDIGRWHLDQASTMPNAALARFHLSEAIATLRRRQGDRGLSLEDLESWAEDHPDRGEWLRSMLVSEISNTLQNDTGRMHMWAQRVATEERERSHQIETQVHAIRAGTADAELMYEVWCVWEGLAPYANGATPTERFANCFDDGLGIMQAAESGLSRCPARDDLPTVDEVIALSLHKKQHLICMPCLIGMALRWNQGSSAIEALPETTLETMVAFYLTDGMEDTPAWFRHLILHRPPLVARVLVEYVGKTLKSKQDYITGTHALEHDDAYRTVAEIGR
ncbi:MAG: hypothetical protein PHQ14_13770, partial [Chromatiales bacterium]|nr:hypothetical protein [Chromatiales bacterium]